MAENEYKVPSKQWRKWDQQQRALFNSVYSELKRMGPDLFLHPTTVQRNLFAEEFHTIAWNAAWLAANALRRDFIDEVRTVYRGEVIAIDRLARRSA